MNNTIKDDEYALPALLVAFGGIPTMEENGGQEEARRAHIEALTLKIDHHRASLNAVRAVKRGLEEQ